jgi:hypothetical protein
MLLEDPASLAGSFFNRDVRAAVANIQARVRPEIRRRPERELESRLIFFSGQAVHVRGDYVGHPSLTLTDGDIICGGMAAQSHGNTPVALHFPNASRHYILSQRCICFWGHDSAFEISFHLDEDALFRMSPHTERGKEARKPMLYCRETEPGQNLYSLRQGHERHRVERTEHDRRQAKERAALAHWHKRELDGLRRWLPCRKAGATENGSGTNAAVTKIACDKFRPWTSEGEI